jgi:hypothetical protein
VRGENWKFHGFISSILDEALRSGKLYPHGMSTRYSLNRRLDGPKSRCVHGVVVIWSPLPPEIELLFATYFAGGGGEKRHFSSYTRKC